MVALEESLRFKQLQLVITSIEGSTQQNVKKKKEDRKRK